MIISASRRNDIPAFFSEWFFNRIKEGFLLVRNPMNIHQVSRISLSPDVVDCIVFWSKNPTKMLNRLNEINKFDYYFQFTVNGYGQRLEPNVIELDKVVDTFRKLSDSIGPKRVIWRYDPIVISAEYDYGFHVNNFGRIIKLLKGKTNRCVISFVDLYKNAIRNMSPINPHDFTNEFIVRISDAIKQIAQTYNVELVTCAEVIDLKMLGISRGKCIDDKLIHEVFGTKLEVDKDKNQRQECGCVASIDIGSYNTCPHNCLYCYANNNLNMVRENFASYDPKSPLLFGKIESNDKITDRKVYSCKEIQQVLFSENFIDAKRDVKNGS
jgi:hypothetical protein